MTTKHPAHGPVSLDRLHQIREILSKAAAQSDGGNLGYAMADAVKVINSAIAAFGTEPVADVVSWSSPNEERTCDIRLRRHDIAPGPLYTAPPAPVVPDDGREQFESWMLKKWGRERQEYDFAMGKFLHGENYADSYTRHMWKAWSASRAAMLQSFGKTEQVEPVSEIAVSNGGVTEERLAEILGYKNYMLGTVSKFTDDEISMASELMFRRRMGGNSPVTPDGWIPVSERRPDKLIPVMVMYADGEMWSAMWSGQFWDDGCTIPDPHSITHWREMPAAPQQEVN